MCHIANIESGPKSDVVGCPCIKCEQKKVALKLGNPLLSNISSHSVLIVNTLSNTFQFPNPLFLSVIIYVRVKAKVKILLGKFQKKGFKKIISF